ncbi:MAG: hypothetical protein U9O53_06240 [archaeon]|nr:hypothetical protein [archaeon]
MGFKFELFGNLKKKSAPKEHPASAKGSVASPDVMSGTASAPSSLPSSDAGQAAPTMSQPAASPSAGIPAGITDDINALVAKGASEADMIKELKAKGYNFKDIDNALGQVIKSQVSGENLSALTPQMSAEQPADDSPQNNSAPSDFSQQMSQQQAFTRNDSLEAMIESIVEERLVSFKTMIDKITESIEDIRGEIDNLDTSLKMVETHTGSTLSDMKKEIDVLREDFSDVSPKVSSIEKAFHDVVPNLVGAISEVNEKLHIKSKDIDTESLDLEPDVDKDKKDEKGEKDEESDKCTDDVTSPSEKHEDTPEEKKSSDKDDDEREDKF